MIFIGKIINSPILWFVVTIIIYKIAEQFKKHLFFSKIPPTCLAAISLIFLLKICSIKYQCYNSGGSLITYLLGPATIALALPLVKSFDILKQNFKVILAGVSIATFTGIFSVYLIAEILKATKPIVLSLIPKAVTTPIAVEISKSIGGIPELTAAIVVITGLTGYLFGHKLLKILKIKNNISIGLAIGSSSHVIGTSRCMEISPVQAAISSISLILVGFLTAILAPLIVRLLY
ncbi:MAG: LrgB family protein [bacterium]